MPLVGLTVSNFRCFEAAELQADPQYNLIVGPNASGKSSLLEAIAYLGRGKSFRGASTRDLIRHGESEFVLFGRVDVDNRQDSVGVRNSSAGLEIRINGADAASAAALVETLPLQVIDPDVHNLVGGAPEERRRYLDWVAFHVEHQYLDTWRRFRKALKQRNAALKAGSPDSELASWEQEIVSAGGMLDQQRKQIVDIAQELFEETAGGLLDVTARLEYRQGWSQDLSLQEALVATRGRDREHGNTQAGPHRADLRLAVDDRQARRLVSRGQQKLLACSLILTATEMVQTHLERPLLLLIDDPAAELDGNSLELLMRHVAGLGCQVVATSLTAAVDLFPEAPRVFHVERGVLSDKTSC